MDQAPPPSVRFYIDPSRVLTDDTGYVKHVHGVRHLCLSARTTKALASCESLPPTPSTSKGGLTTKGKTVDDVIEKLFLGERDGDLSRFNLRGTMY